MAEEEKKYGVKNPNEGTDGRVASNMTGEAIEGMYDEQMSELPEFTPSKIIVTKNN